MKLPVSSPRARFSMSGSTIPRTRHVPTAVRTFQQLICIVLLAVAALPAWAQVSREQAAAQAQQQTGGRVLSVDLADAGGRAVWRVKVVTPRGEVRVVMVDAGGGSRR
jgi:Peptidase propeptide and YPEB domain